MNSTATSRPAALLPRWLLALLVIAGVFSGCGREPQRAPSSTAAAPAASALKRALETGVIRAAYGGFPPYSETSPSDPSLRTPRGFCIDLLEEIARRHNPPLRIEWGKVNWATLRADFASDKYDVLADAVYYEISRASDFIYTEPFSYFGIGCAVVRKSDTRFSKFADLDRSDITISVAVGWTSTEYARRLLTKPKFKEVIVEESPSVQLDDVLYGRADVALQDVPTVIQYAKAHPDEVKALWVDHPPSLVAAGFMLNKGSEDLRDFLNVALTTLELDGTIQRIDERWGGLGHYAQISLRPGAGLAKK